MNKKGKKQRWKHKALPEKLDLVIEFIREQVQETVDNMILFDERDVKEKGLFEVEVRYLE
ncbi:hypothetical protein I6N95_20830 [Vagococcus sp. BWB3-3]|uniref:Uncharacterized protein n=1 Tax=Vagococcus allomyrinae TaxID=2794353 RepID=A0A940PGF4_9ENTE|nr:hypothetical protein [Vagococcus allomyrinae]MBP1043473.1 hypothetical protein [Vagococcus allomyrinae]